MSLRVGIHERLVGAVDRAERPVRARLEPAVRDDPRDARRCARPERRVAGAGLGVQVRVVRVPLHVPLVEQALEPGDEVRPVVEEALHLEAVDRDEDRQLRRADRRGGRLLPSGLREREEGDDEGDAEGEGGEAELLHYFRAGPPGPGDPSGFYGAGARSPFGARGGGVKKRRRPLAASEEDEERGAEDERNVYRLPGCPLQVVDPVEEVDPVVRAFRSGSPRP